jgi:CRISPR-associated exonuclease Cas4
MLPRSIYGSCLGVARTLALVFQHARVWLAARCGQSSDLADCRLMFAEKSFSINAPIRLTARVDRAYHDGVAMILMELKTRYHERVYASDIIEVSAQRLAVECSTGMRVHDFGYIVLQNPMKCRRTTLKISLLAQDEVVGLANRQSLLIGRAFPPRRAGNPECCRRCEYQSECRDYPRHTTDQTD